MPDQERQNNGLEATLLNSFKLSLQYILPKLWLTRLAGWGASKRAGWLTKLVIDLFVKYYKVDMKEAQKPDTASYRTFNEFFVRPLRDEVRPLNTDPNVLVMPADGVISQLGKIEDDKILQAKGHNYSLEALLAGNYIMADLFRNGTFATTYLSPRDYHRVHMPCNGILREMIYVPGDLFSVNHLTAQNVPNLFARNERVICLLDSGGCYHCRQHRNRLGGHHYAAARRRDQALDLACRRRRRFCGPAERSGNGPLQAGLNGHQPVRTGQS